MSFPGRIANREPIADAGQDLTVPEGTLLQFDGRGSNDPDGDALAYEWDFGDGNFGMGITPFHAYADDGTYTVTLTVLDGFGGSNSDMLTVLVTNVAPPLITTALGDPSVFSLIAPETHFGALGRIDRQRFRSRHSRRRYLRPGRWRGLSLLLRLVVQAGNGHLWANRSESADAAWCRRHARR